MREVNKKVLGIALVLLFVAVLATPIVGTVMAGKGQEKLSFEFQLSGLPDTTTGDVNEAGNNVQVRNRLFYSLGNTFVLIDEGGPNEELITAEYLDYEGHMYTKNHQEKGFYCILVREIVYIYADTDKETLRGTLEIKALGQTHEPLESGTTFEGHGTGEFEGVKILGNSVTIIDPSNPNPPYYYVVLDRVGTVMGWPT